MAKSSKKTTSSDSKSDRKADKQFDPKKFHPNGTPRYDLSKYQFKKGDPRASEAVKKLNEQNKERYYSKSKVPLSKDKLRIAALERKLAEKKKLSKERSNRIVLYQANRMLSPQDKEYARLIAEGSMTSKTKAYIKAYDIVLPPKGTPEYRKKYEQAKQNAISKTKSQKIARAIQNAESKIEEIYVDSLDTLHDLVRNGRSEKVRAEVGIEFLRQKRGAPTTTVKNDTGNQQVIIMVGERPTPKVSDTNKYFVEGEVVETTADNSNIVSDTSQTEDGLSDIIDVRVQ